MCKLNYTNGDEFQLKTIHNLLGNYIKLNSAITEKK